MRTEGANITENSPNDIPGSEWKEKAREAGAATKVAGAAAWEATKAGYQELQRQTIACSKVTDQAIRGNPYVSLGIAFGIGLALGVLLNRGEESEGTCNG
jgi:ElaB/YqjD/DUF883 family membrane-anchored ribosome-binding protein